MGGREINVYIQLPRSCWYIGMSIRFTDVGLDVTLQGELLLANAKQGSPQRSSHGGLFVGGMTRYGPNLVIQYEILSGLYARGRGSTRLLPGG
jgi:hypothetical protein